MTKHTGFTLTSLRPPDPEVSCCDGTVFRLPAKISACGPAQLSVLQQLTGNRTFPADSVQYTIKQLPCQNRSLVHRVVASAGGVRITPFFSAFSAARLKQPFSVTNFFDLYFHHFHWITKNHISLLQTLMTLFFQVGNIRSRIDPPNAFLLASKRLRAGGQSPPADEGPSDRSDEEIPGAVRENNPGSGLATPIRQLSVRT